MVQGADLVSVIDQSVGVYGTAPTCYLSTLARMPDLTIAGFDDAVADRQLVRVRAMRNSVHTLPVARVALAAAATRGIADRLNSGERMAERVYERLVTAIDDALDGGPLSAVEIRRAVDPERQLGDLPGVALARAAEEFRVVRTTTSGTWRSDRFSYARWSDWLPDVDPEAFDALEAKRNLVEWYVEAYGPVELDDVKWWTGWTKAETIEVIEGIDLDSPGRATSLLTGTRLLPVWDVLMVAYRIRDRLLDPSHMPLVYDRYGNATSVVLQDGRVIGQWDLGSDDSPLRVKVAAFSDWPDSTWEEVEAEANRIGSLIEAASVTVERVEEPTDLLDSSRNRFLAPLSRR